MNQNEFTSLKHNTIIKKYFNAKLKLITLLQSIFLKSTCV